MGNVAVVIPCYKEKLDTNEKISLTQCRKILGRYDRFLLAPCGINIEDLSGERVVYTDKENLSSRKNYSDYVLSIEFYELFKGYEFILIYQLDAFVFIDKLEYFCGLDYDYIGGEWLYGLECHLHEQKLWYFGNGGLSLRRVDAFRKWISENQDVVDYARMLLPEDIAISIFGKDDLRIAGRDVAMDFSFDLHPEECYKMHDERLPFGCHGWDRFDAVFWKKIIDSYGYEVELNDVYDDENRILCSGKERSQKLKQYFDPNKINGCLKKLFTGWNGELSIFGAGQYGFSFINMVENTGITVKYVIDNDINKIGKKVEGIDIVSLSTALSRDALPILIALMKPLSVEKQLIEKGLVKGRDYICSVDLQNEMLKGKGSIPEN